MGELNKHFKLRGNDYNKKKIKEWYLEEENYHNKYVGGRDIKYDVLHHMPNINYILSELARVLKPNGIMIIKEPLSSMRPTRIDSKGLSPNERGIPTDFFMKEFKKLNLKVLAFNYANYPPLLTLIGKKEFLKNKFCLNIFYYLDKILSSITGKHSKYQRSSLLERCAAGSVYYVVKKRIIEK